MPYNLKQYHNERDSIPMLLSREESRYHCPSKIKIEPIVNVDAAFPVFNQNGRGVGASAPKRICRTTLKSNRLISLNVHPLFTSLFCLIAFRTLIYIHQPYGSLMDHSRNWNKTIVLRRWLVVRKVILKHSSPW